MSDQTLRERLLEESYCWVKTTGSAITKTQVIECRRLAQLLREAATAISEGETPQSERERLHAIIADCHGLIDPEQHPELCERIVAVLLPCDEAGKCVQPSGEAADPASVDQIRVVATHERTGVRREHEAPADDGNADLCPNCGGAVKANRPLVLCRDRWHLEADKA